MRYFFMIILMVVVSSANEYKSQHNEGEKLFTQGMDYLLGYKVKENNTKAFKFFHKAARQNNKEAKYFMGICFDQGIGVKEQKELARYWYRQAANAGYRKAIYKLAEVEKDLKIRIFRKESYIAINFK